MVAPRHGGLASLQNAVEGVLGFRGPQRHIQLKVKARNTLGKIISDKDLTEAIGELCLVEAVTLDGMKMDQILAQLLVVMKDATPETSLHRWHGCSACCQDSRWPDNLSRLTQLKTRCQQGIQFVKANPRLKLEKACTWLALHARRPPLLLPLEPPLPQPVPLGFYSTLQLILETRPKFRSWYEFRQSRHHCAHESGPLALVLSNSPVRTYLLKTLEYKF